MTSYTQITLFILLFTTLFLRSTLGISTNHGLVGMCGCLCVLSEARAAGAKTCTVSPASWRQ